jgi:hypothetical protein
MSKPTITVTKDAANPEPIELLAKSIVLVAEGFEQLNRSTLNRRALVVLLHDGIGAGKITKAQINLVLDNLPRLKAWYIRK